MKKSILIASIAVLLSFAGCGSNSPEGAVENFYKALGTGDKDLLEKSTTPQAHAIMSMALSMMPATDKADLQDPIEIVNVEKQGDHAAIVESKTKAGKTHKDTVVEIDGEWKVDAKK